MEVLGGLTSVAITSEEGRLEVGRSAYAESLVFCETKVGGAGERGHSI